MSNTAAKAAGRLNRRRLPAAAYVDGILHGDRVTLARAITLIESELEADAELAQHVLEALLPHAGNSRRIGITGVPGAGKSTFIDALGMHLIKDRSERLAVLSVDPSSAASKGSILGDKTRMERLAMDDRAFIRPSPSGGHLGGVARRTRETILLCEAAGFQNIFVETIGVGQSEVAVRSMTDFFLLLMIAGAGDELQGMKRGIIEMVDMIAINKADGDNQARAERARVEYASALHLLAPSPDGWGAPVVPCSALTADGVSAIWDTVLEHRTKMESSGRFQLRRQRQALDWMNELVLMGLEEQFRRSPQIQQNEPKLKQEVLAGSVSPFAAARTLLGIMGRKE